MTPRLTGIGTKPTFRDTAEKVGFGTNYIAVDNHSHKTRVNL